MNKTSTIAGIEVAFGARWGDEKRKARLKTTCFETVGYFDDKKITKKHRAAVAVATRMIDRLDKLSSSMVFFHDDAGEIFGSVLLANGQIMPGSEEVHDDSDAWEAAIAHALEDENIELVYVPESAGASHRKIIPFVHRHDGIEAKDLPEMVPASPLGMVIAVIFMLLIVSSIPIGAWIWIAEPFKKVEEPIYIVEKLKPNYQQVLERCAADLGEPWPVPPEWTLQQEGCVGAPDLARILIPKPGDQRPYVYRFYDLDGPQWDEYLSKKSFLKMAERFPGQVIEGTNQFVLFIPYDLEKDLIDDNYLPDTNPTAILRQNFVGALRVAGEGMNGTKATTNLELDRVIERLFNKRLTPSHVYREVEGQRTSMEIAPERIESRQVRIN